MKRLIFLSQSTLFFAIASTSTAQVQEHRIFTDRDRGDYYDPSWGFVSPPSFLELVNEKLPVDAGHAFAGRNSLKLHWISKAGGDWGVAVASDGWLAFDVTLRDSLAFMISSEAPIAAPSLPVIYLEDVRDWKAGKLKLSDYVSDIPGRQWVQVKLSTQVFKRLAGGADLSRIKTVFFGQSAPDAMEHTIYVDDLKIFGGEWLAKYKFIVVLGSSTAAGAGASTADSAWVNRFSQSIGKSDTSYQVVNLAVAGYSTYRIMPDGFQPPAGRAFSDAGKNLSTAMDYYAKAIIINLPCNDVAYGYSIAEQVANFDTLAAYAHQHNVPLWISTTQPRNFASPEMRQTLIAMRDSLLHRFPGNGVQILDFWSEIADTDGRIKPQYDSGDGVHLNDAGHRILFERVVAARLRESLSLGTEQQPKQETSMIKPWLKIFAIHILLLVVLSSQLRAQAKLLDDFENLSSWKAIVSDGVTATIENAPGISGNALALDFEMHGSGYAIAHKRLPLDLPDNYKFSFYLRGETPINNFEFKLLDSLDNVYWIKQLNVEYPREWKKKAIKKRHITFAWGPAGGGMPKKVDRIEFVVSAGEGGKGKMFVDEFKFEAIDDSAQPGAAPEVKVSSAAKGSALQITPDGNSITNWLSAGKEERQWLTVNFQKEREIGGLTINWNVDDFATAYNVELSGDGKTWSLGQAINNRNGGRDHIYLPETEARFVRLNLKKSSRGKGYGINRIDIKGAEFSATPNAFFTAVAAEAPRGHYPKYFSKEQTFWTIVGASGDPQEALINENGAIEVDKAGLSLEPFLFVDNKLITWNEVTQQQSLDQDYLPIPSVRWDYKNLQLKITAFAAGNAGKSFLMARYHLENQGSTTLQGKLFIAVRPFQVLPPWQELNIVGGAGRIDSLACHDGVVRVNQSKKIIPLVMPDGFGATDFAAGDITEYLQQGTLPTNSRAVDPLKFASGALQFDLNLVAREAKEVCVLVPFREMTTDASPTMSSESAKIFADLALGQTRGFWESKLNAFEIKLPATAQEIVNTFKSQLAYVLINRDGPAIQPGSRTYERAWIRDGALTSAAMLQTGNTNEVREYLDWYAPHQYPSGKIPCAVDTRGADPVPEHDSHGEFIYAVLEYYRFTHDKEWLAGKFAHVIKAVRYIQELRRERMTEVYRTGIPEQRACYGLVPESISHEGYSAKPMHSYWDDFFILRGLKDATAIASILGERQLEKEFAAERDDFRNALYNSMRLAMTNKNIDFIPGCVELGDFDATSTTIGVYPVNEVGNIPEPQLHNTFDRYFQYFTRRQRKEIEWRDYTPYELRLIGTFVFLDQKERAFDLLSFFMKDRRPAGWNHWAEVVWRDPATPRFIGDMPHSWVGSDFMRSIRSMFVYEREKDEALVIGAGILEDWVREPSGVEVKKLPTYYGVLNYKMKMEGENLVAELSGNLQMPAGKIILKPPLAAEVKAVTVNGKKRKSFSSKEVIISEFPAKIVLGFTAR